MYKNKIQLSKDQIKEIYEDLDVGYRCYYHFETKEIKSIPDIDEDYLDPKLWSDFISDIEENEDDYFVFSKMNTHEYFDMMSAFAQTVKEKSFQNHLIDVLRKPKPFRHFKDAIDNFGSYRQKWFDFKELKYCEWIEQQIESYNNENINENENIIDDERVVNQKEVKALDLFKSGLNCAQSVLTVFSDNLNFDNNLAMGISCGFGAGMGRLQETCGAVTGSFMVISIYNYKKYSENLDRKEKSYSMIQDFSAKFNSIYGTLNCKSLLKSDLKTAEGRQFVKDNKLDEIVCEKCITNSIRIIDELID
jgi:C_GCAxxG_C_C family probable redox protein